MCILSTNEGGSFITRAIHAIACRQHLTSWVGNKLIANVFVVLASLLEVEVIDRLTLTAMDFKAGAGKLIMFYDGEKVKCGRGVIFLTSVTGHGDIWKKITIKGILDKI